MARPVPIRDELLTDKFLDKTYDVLAENIAVNNNIGRALKAAGITRMDLDKIIARDPSFERLLYDAQLDFVDDREQELWAASNDDPKIKVMMLKAHRPHRYDRSGVAQMERVRNQITDEQSTKGLIDGKFEEINEPVKVEDSSSRKLADLRDDLSD